MTEVNLNKKFVKITCKKGSLITTFDSQILNAQNEFVSINKLKLKDKIKRFYYDEQLNIQFNKNAWLYGVIYGLYTQNKNNITIEGGDIKLNIKQTISPNFHIFKYIKEVYKNNDNNIYIPINTFMDDKNFIELHLFINKINKEKNIILMIPQFIIKPYDKNTLINFIIGYTNSCGIIYGNIIHCDTSNFPPNNNIIEMSKFYEVGLDYSPNIKKIYFDYNYLEKYESLIYNKLLFDNNENIQYNLNNTDQYTTDEILNIEYTDEAVCNDFILITLNNKNENYITGVNSYYVIRS